MKRISLVIAILLATQFIFAQNASVAVDRNEALQYGLNYFQAHYPTRAIPQVKSYELLKSVSQSKDCYHVFNFENGGWAIVCADRRGEPILGYSDEGEFRFEDAAPACQDWIRNYMQQLETIDARQMPVSEKNLAAWNASPKRGMTREVDKLLTTKWNQSYPYNMYCPEHSQGNHGHTYTGCVATAMAQVMKYWNWPERGTGYASYYWQEQHLINLADSTFDWENMPNVLYTSSSAEQKNAVATLMFLCGVTINMDYGYQASGTQTEYVVEALKNNFGYRNGVNYKQRDNGSTNQGEFEHYFTNDTIWCRMIMEELDMHRPLVYSGHSESDGHAWVCDGYRLENNTYKFHMNWGWGGASDGWFEILNLITHSSDADESDTNFMYGQGAIFNAAVPDPEVAPYCTAQSLFTEEFWTINDGSYANFYKKNTDCNWLVKVPAYETDTVMFYFNYFELAAGDELRIFAGEDENAELIYNFYEGNEPIDTIKHVGTPLYIHFVSDAEEQARGWEMHYDVLRYPFTITTSVNGVGGTVSPLGVFPVKDRSTLIVSMIPDAGNTVANFTIDGGLTLSGTGLEDIINYTFTDIKANHTLEVTFGPADVNSINNSNISVYPNPSNGKFSVDFGGENVQSCVLYDINGKVVVDKAMNESNVAEFDNNLSAGTYFLKVITNEKAFVEKIVVE